MPLVNTDMYPTNTRYSEIPNHFEMSYTMAELYSRETITTPMEIIDTDLGGPDTPLDTSNVYGWMDENCVFMQRSASAVDLSTGVITQTPMDRGAANLRLMFNNVAGVLTPTAQASWNNMEVKSLDNELFFRANTGVFLPKVWAYRNIPVNRIRYADYILYVQFIVTVIDNNDSIGRWTVPYDNLADGIIGGVQMITREQAGLLLSDGTANFENGTYCIAGINITPYFGAGETELVSDPRTAQKSIYPVVETHCGDTVWIGNVTGGGETGLTYYNHQWVGGMTEPYGNMTMPDGPPELSSMSIINWSRDYRFGAEADFTIDFENTEMPTVFSKQEHTVVKKYRSLMAYNVLPFFTYEECMNMAASFGVYFTFDVNTAINAELGQNITKTYTNNIYLGKRYEDGRCDGTYTRSTETITQPQAQQGVYIVTTEETDTTLEVEPIDPSQPYVPGDDDDPDSDFPKGHDPVGNEPAPNINVSGLVSGSVYTALSAVQMNTLKTRLKQAVTSNPSFWSSIAPKLTVPATNPMFSGQEEDVQFDISDASSNISNYILSCRLYPFDVTETIQGSFTSTENLLFGYKGASLPVNNWELDGLACVVNCGSVQIPYFKEKLTYFDLEPYTKVKIILPCLGAFDLPAQDVVGHTITTRYVADITTGLCTALVTATDNAGNVRTLLTKTGKIAIDVPLSGNDLTAQADHIAVANINRVQTYIGAGTKIVDGVSNAIIGAAAGNTVGAIAGVANGAVSIANGVLDIQLADVNNTIASRDVPKNITTGSGFSSRVGVTTPYIVVQRPVVDEPSGYGRTFGYMWNRKARLGDLTGFTVCANPKMDIAGATEDELAIINSLLRQGVYL